MEVAVGVLVAVKVGVAVLDGLALAKAVEVRAAAVLVVMARTVN